MDMFTIKAQTISGGIALGKVLNFVPVRQVEQKKALPPEARAAEAASLRSAVQAACAELNVAVEEIKRTLGEDKAAIFACHLDILMDDEFQKDMFDLIAQEGYAAPYAAKVVSEKNALEMEELEDPLFAARAADFRDIGQRLISCLSDAGGADTPFPPKPAVVVAPFLTPGQTIRFNKDYLRGIVISKGGKNSHAAILARSIGIPAVVVPEDMLSLLKDGMDVVLNLRDDVLIVNPDCRTADEVHAILDRQQVRKEKLLALRDAEPVTLDGHRVQLFANGGSMHDLQDIAASGAGGIGLFRTEFLFMEQNSLPDQDIQAACYHQVLRSVPGKTVIFRLLDVGGDKPLPYMPMEAEKNPFLGIRGIRFLLANPEILRTQIRSMLMASVSAEMTVRIMVPMVVSVDEMEQAAEVLAQEQAAVGGDAVLGMMVETPAAALSVSAYKGLAGFISIGSNDLTQYTLAVDRESERLSSLYTEFHPAVLSLMRKTVQDAHACGMEAGVCGEFASKPEGAALLAGFGFDELSMSPGMLPAVKELILGSAVLELRQLAAQVENKRTPRAVFEVVSAYLDSKGLR